METFVVRQPVFDKEQQVVGYELLFRDGLANFYPPAPGGGADCAAFQALAGGKTVFINIAGDNAGSGPGELLSEQACLELRAAGWQLMLDDFLFRDRFQVPGETAPVVKFGFMAFKAEANRQPIRQAVAAKVKLLAAAVDTEEDYRRAVDLGFTYFQGYFCRRPAATAGKEPAPAEILQLQLLQEINREDFDLVQLETVIKRDVAFSYKLFRYINSAWFGFRSKIKSIRQAIVLLGPQEIRRWASLVTVRDLSRDKPGELFVTAVVRGRLCELLTQAAGFPNRRRVRSSSACSPCWTP